MALVENFSVPNDARQSKLSHLRPGTKGYTINEKWNFNDDQALKTTKQVQIRKVAYQVSRPMSEGRNHSYAVSLISENIANHVSNALDVQTEQNRSPKVRQHFASQVTFTFDVLAYGLLTLGIVSLFVLWGGIVGDSSHSPIFLLTLAIISLLISSALRKAAKSLRYGSKSRA